MKEKSPIKPSIENAGIGQGGIDLPTASGPPQAFAATWQSRRMRKATGAGAPCPGYTLPETDPENPAVLFWKRQPGGRIAAGALLVMAAILFLSMLAPPPSSGGAGKVYVIPVHGTVEPGLSVFIKMALTDTPADQGDVFVLEMDTFGGRVDSALAIVDQILFSGKNRTIAYVSSKAISAGALIALSCNELVMKHNTTIGDCAPIIYSKEGPKMMGEKFQSPLRAKFRTLARKNGYPEKLAEAMVTSEMEVFRVEMEGQTRYMEAREIEELSAGEKEKIRSKKTIVAKGELLTMDDVEAKETGFSKMSVESLPEMLERLSLSDREVVRIEESWSHALVRLIIRATPILMMIGLAALFIELKAPGFGVPGIVGIICLAIVFLGQHIAGLANYTELLLIFLGIVLVGIELFILPAFGVCGFAGLFCILAGMILSLQDFNLPDPSFPWQRALMVKNITVVIGSLLSSFLVSIMFIRYVLPKAGKIVSGPYLSTTLATSHADSEEMKKAKAGDTGRAITALRPSGKAMVGSEVLDVITEGDFIDMDTPLLITAIRGNRIIVVRNPSP